MFELLLLILVANGSPVIAHYLLSNRFALPVDFGASFNNKRLLGDSKTWRGVVVSLLLTLIVALLLGHDASTGLLVSATAMLGDLLSSFIKRRLSMPSSSMAPFLDQVPESLFPSLLMADVFSLSMMQIVMLVVIFIVLELLLSRQLYKMGIRRRPY